MNHHEMKCARTLVSVYSEKELRCAKLLLENMAEGLSTVKGMHSQDDVIPKMCAMRMLSSNAIVGNRLCRAIGRMLKLAPQNLRVHALGRADVLDDEGKDFAKLPLPSWRLPEGRGAESSRVPLGDSRVPTKDCRSKFKTLEFSTRTLESPFRALESKFRIIESPFKALESPWGTLKFPRRTLESSMGTLEFP
ncbi:hypothetical protein R1flu_001865 [Riccia fluitans]|uniref:Uncharacterized protein n=1 Tax=Riccia fluitans TaxID=41844 RepID=A0ABD1Y4I2_9MARC